MEEGISSLHFFAFIVNEGVVNTPWNVEIARKVARVLELHLITKVRLTISTLSSFWFGRDAFSISKYFR